MAEPGHWTPSDAEAKNLRAYLLKGGFMIFDDFEGQDLVHLVTQMRRVVPELQPIELDGSEPIWKSFFEVDPRTLQFGSYRGFGDERYFGYFENNDRTRRQLAILNANNDIGEFMEYNDTGFSAVDMTNEAYKLGVNYIVYALTH